MARLSAFRGQVRAEIRILRKAPLVPGCRWPCCPRCVPRRQAATAPPVNRRREIMARRRRGWCRADGGGVVRARDQRSGKTAHGFRRQPKSAWDSPRRAPSALPDAGRGRRRAGRTPPGSCPAKRHRGRSRQDDLPCTNKSASPETRPETCGPGAKVCPGLLASCAEGGWRSWVQDPKAALMAGFPEQISPFRGVGLSFRRRNLVRGRLCT